MKKVLLVAACLMAVWAALPAEAALQLPNYAQGGSLSTTVQAKGKAITDIISMIVAILAIIGMIIGGGYFTVGNGEMGKKFLFGGVIGLIIAGSAYAIAALVA
jgi:hypothetical protein